MVWRRIDGRAWRASERSKPLAIKKEDDYDYKNCKDDCQNNWDGDRNSRSGPSLDDRHYRSIFLSVRPSQLNLAPRRPLLP